MIRLGGGAPRARVLSVPASLLALLLCGAVAALPAVASAQAGGVFEEGVDRFRAGDYPEAQRLLREYVELAGEQGGDVAANLGEAYHYLGLMTPDAKLAEGYFLAVAERYPTSPLADESVARLARLYAARGDYDEARRQWQTLASSYPFSRYRPETSLRIGETYFAERNWTAAYDAFSAGFARMKDYQREGGRGANLRDLEGEHVYWLGRTLLARGAYADARKYLNLLELDYPGHALEPLALYYLAESDRAAGGDREGAGAWRRFSESVRNTSLESVAESPNLPAVARAREAGDLDRPRAREAGAAREDERGARPSAEQPVGDLAEADDDRDEERLEPAPPAVGDRAAPPPVSPPADDAPALRAPEPGRPGGISDEGRAAEDGGDGDGDRPETGDRAAASDGGRALRGAVAPAPSRDAGPEQERRPGPERTPGADRAAEPESPEVEDQPVDATPAAPAPGRADVAAAPPAAAPPGELEPIAPGPVYLQVGAFTRAASASGLSSELRRKGFEPSIDTGIVNGEGYYRVRVGPFQVPAERTRLEDVRAALLAAGYGPVTTRPEPGR
ncbi:MAG TPA: SPOR domain-containing protein [Gemmatimonadota bacterium]|jgi:TolA-binding protein/cell division septation protein DedD